MTEVAVDPVSVIGTLLGIGVGWAVAAYYYRKRPNVCLLGLLTQETVLFAGVDEDVRGQLKIEYRDRQVGDLTQIEFAIANRGSVAIDTPVRPLTLTAVDVESSWDLLDVAVVAHSSSSVNAQVERDASLPHVVRIPFDILNPDDYFQVKVLLSGEYSASNLQLTVTGRNLPPEIKLSPRSELKPRWLALVTPLAMLVPIGLLFLGVGAPMLWLRGRVPGWLLPGLGLLLGLAAMLLGTWLGVSLQEWVRSRDKLWTALRGKSRV